MFHDGEYDVGSCINNDGGDDDDDYHINVNIDRHHLDQESNSGSNRNSHSSNNIEANDRQAVNETDFTAIIRKAFDRKTIDNKTNKSSCQRKTNSGTNRGPDP